MIACRKKQKAGDSEISTIENILMLARGSYFLNYTRGNGNGKEEKHLWEEESGLGCREPCCQSPLGSEHGCGTHLLTSAVNWKVCSTN